MYSFIKFLKSYYPTQPKPEPKPEQRATLSSIVINDGLHALETNTNPYGVPRNLINYILSYRIYNDVKDAIKANYMPEGQYCYNDALTYATEYNHTWLVDYFMSHNAIITRRTFDAAVISGNLDLVKRFEYIMEPRYSHTRTRYWCYAALHNHKHIMDYFTRCGVIPEYEIVTNHAAMGGHLELVKFFINLSTNKNHAKRNAMSGALYGNHIKIRDYIISLGCTIDYYMIQSAAEGGHIESLNFVLRYVKDVSYIIKGASIGGHLDIIKQYIHELNVNVYNDFHKHCIEYAISNGHLEIVKYLLREFNHVITNEYFSTVLSNKNLAIVKYFTSMGATISEHIIGYAIYIANIPIIDHLFNCIGKPRDYHIRYGIGEALFRCDINLFKYFQSKGFNDWNMCLSYIREKGCPSKKMMDYIRTQIKDIEHKTELINMDNESRHSKTVSHFILFNIATIGVLLAMKTSVNKNT